MKIAYVITRSDNIGGAHIHVRDLSLALLQQGNEVIVLAGQEGPFSKELQTKGVRYYSLKYLVRPIRPWVDLRGVWELREVLAEYRPDLISTHSAKAGWIGRLTGRMLGIPTLFTAHGWAFTDGVPEHERKVYALAERLVAPFAARIITVSDYDRQLALRYRVASPEKLVTVHNGMPDVPRSFWADPRRDPPRLVMVARFELQKDHATLLRALTGIKGLDWQLDLIGDGPLRPQVEDLVDQLSLRGRVRFWGSRRDVAERLAEAQVFLLISNWEGFPRSILEAMRAGLPVVASDVGGVREAVVDGETGFLVPRSDVGALRDRLLRLIRDPALRARMGAAGRRRYERYFTFERMLEKTLRVYEEVLARAGGV